MLDLSTKTTNPVSFARLTNVVSAFNEWLVDNSSGTEIEDVTLLYEGEDMMLLSVYAEEEQCQLWVTFTGDPKPDEVDEPIEIETMTQYFDTMATVLKT